LGLLCRDLCPCNAEVKMPFDAQGNAAIEVFELVAYVGVLYPVPLVSICP